MSGQKPNFVQMALDWLVRATGHVPIGREQSLAKELERVYEAGVQTGQVATQELIEEALAEGFRLGVKSAVQSVRDNVPERGDLPTHLEWLESDAGMAALNPKTKKGTS